MWSLVRFVFADRCSLSFPWIRQGSSSPWNGMKCSGWSPSPRVSLWLLAPSRSWNVIFHSGREMCYFLLKLPHKAIRNNPGRPNGKCLVVLLALQSCNFAELPSLCMRVPPPFCSAKAQLGFRHGSWLGGHGLPKSVGLVLILGRPKEQDCLALLPECITDVHQCHHTLHQPVGIVFGFTAGETEAWCSCSKLLQVSQWVILQTNKRERGDAVMLHSGLWWADSEHQSCVVCTQRFLLSSGHTLISPTTRGDLTQLLGEVQLCPAEPTDSDSSAMPSSVCLARLHLGGKFSPFYEPLQVTFYNRNSVRSLIAG